MNTRVSVFVVGAQKAGTSSLYAHFTEHPALCAPAKEVHFFDDESIDWSNPDYTKLDRQYEQFGPRSLRYDITPIYGFWPPSLQRIQAYNPDAKIIFLFRDPFDRAWSHWRMEYGRGTETLPFADAIRQGRDRMANLPPLAVKRRIYSYIERGMYSVQVRRAMSFFPKGQVLFLNSTDLWRDHVTTLASIAAFLGIDPFPQTGAKHEHESKIDDLPSARREEDRAYIADLVAKDTQTFAGLTGIDISDWPVMQAPPASVPRRRADAARSRIALSSSKPNVVFIVADDLNSWIGALGRQPDVRTPAIDALARRGTLFSHAYCSAPYCNASRMGVFTGCLPATTGLYHNEDFWGEPRRQTYVEAFKAAGYTTFGAGKVFHGSYDYATAGRTGQSAAKWIDIANRPYLWDRFETNGPEPLPANRPMNGMFDFSHFDAVPAPYHLFDWGPLPASADPSTPDELMCQSIERFLADPGAGPFFCAAGIYKPHLPWHVPQRFFDLYQTDELTLPLVRKDDLEDVPAIAQKWALNPPDHALIVNHGLWRHAIHGYLAAVSYCDWILGRIVAALDKSKAADNTIIAFWSDNGFHLGEKLHWRKFVLWEEATRVPLIIVPPRRMPRLPCYTDPVSLIDLGPTLADLCGIDGPDSPDGESLVPAMTEENTPGRPVITTWGRGNHSLRLGDWRYTRYKAGGEEAYNHRLDPHEWTNLVGDARFASKINGLRRLMP
jgi:arylsulfatase A-like enzyme